MTEETTRLNIERAREALTRARMDQVSAAVRAPRPADLSRLREEQDRRASIDSRAGAFRETVRSSLGLGEYRGPGVPTTSYVAQAMSAPLCDADICAPALHPALQTLQPQTSGEAAAPAAPTTVTATPEVAAQDTDAGAPPPAYGEASPARATATMAEETVTDEGDAFTALPEGYVAEETPAPATAPKPRKRRKFLGIF
ncbi:hypothetical protein ACWCOP_05815 [Maricaulaceae bacterium MS644]